MITLTARISISADIEIVIDNRNMISLDRTIMDRSDISKPNWGIIANSGNIEFNDLGGEIKDYIEQQLLKSDLSVYFEIRNTLVENKVERAGKEGFVPGLTGADGFRLAKEGVKEFPETDKFILEVSAADCAQKFGSSAGLYQ